MSAPVFGIINTRPNDEPLPVVGADFSKISMVSTSEDADSSLFPIDEPVRFSTSDLKYTTALGSGYLADAVRGISAQLSELQVAADVTVVRVAEGSASEPQQKLEQTIANMIGSGASRTGIHALRDAPSHVNATPRIVLTPGYDAWRPDSNSANPILAELPAILNGLLAIAVADVSDGSRDAAIAARETVQSERIMLVGTGARVYEGTENPQVVTRPMAPRIAGLFARTDHAHGGKPFHPIANQPVYGIVGPSRPIEFSITDGAVEGQQLLAADIGIVVRGETGVDTAIADGGFVFIGTESCAEGELWSQIHQVRGADYITVKLMRLARQFLGKQVNADLVEAWINSIRFMLRDHKAANDILGYDVQFKPAMNSAEEVRLGHLTVSPYIEHAPVFRVATHEVRRYRPAVDALVKDIVARLNSVA